MTILSVSHTRAMAAGSQTQYSQRAADLNRHPRDACSHADQQHRTQSGTDQHHHGVPAACCGGPIESWRLTTGLDAHALVSRSQADNQRRFSKCTMDCQMFGVRPGRPLDSTQIVANLCEARGRRAAVLAFAAPAPSDS